MIYQGMKVVYSDHALETTRLFPESKHRSKRIYKKLIKRFGGEFIKKPCVWKYRNDTLFIHPTLKAEFERMIGEELNKRIESDLSKALRGIV